MSGPSGDYDVMQELAALVSKANGRPLSKIRATGQIVFVPFSTTTKYMKQRPVFKKITKI